VRIALDATYSVDARPSGIAIYSRELMAGLAAEGRAHQFLHCYRPKQWKKAPPPLAANVRNRLLLPPLHTFSADLYHALNQRVDKRPAKSVISTFHDLFVMTGDYSSPEFRRRFTEQARNAARQSDLIIAVSEFTARQVEELLGFERARIRVVPHGVHFPVSAPDISREKMILFVGALQRRKNIERLVSAMDYLPADWRLVLAGSPSGFQAGQILEQIASSSRTEQITVTGYVPADELEELYWRASIFAFPSLDEGFGIPVIEAMAHGVPVVTSDRSALAEVAGGAALKVDPEDNCAIVAALLRLVESAQLRIELARAGLTHAAQFSWARSVRETWAVYSELLGREI
jgi:glycosyltransferase involved in cell wall biosynthesis